MARRPSTQPTERELDILGVLWDHGTASLGQICETLRRQRDVATTTVATMLKVMLGKKLVKRKQTSSGPVWTARVSREATGRRMVGRLLDRIFDGSAQLMVTSVLDAGDLTKRDIDELRRVLDEYRAGKPAKDKPAKDKPAKDKEAQG